MDDTTRMAAPGSAYGFKLRLYPGFVEEYERRGAELQASMAELLREQGCASCSAFVDEGAGVLFVCLEDDAEAPGEGALGRAGEELWKFMASSVGESTPLDMPAPTHLTCAFHLG